MNFNMYSSNSKEYHQQMMKKHWEQKKQHQAIRKYNEVTNGVEDLNVVHTRSTSNKVNSTEPQNKKYQNMMTPTIQSQPITHQKDNMSSSISSSYCNPITMSPNISRIISHNNTNNKTKQTVDCSKMKKLIRDQLEQSLQQQQINKLKTNVEWQQTKKYMSKQNGVLDYLQKQQSKRNQFIKKCILYQQYNQNTFVNEDLIKTKKINQHVDYNIDPNLFNHESDHYQKVWKSQENKMRDVNRKQKDNLEKRRVQERGEYGRYLDGDQIKSEEWKMKHNPLTNPLEYHVDNPYLRAKLMRY